MSLNFKIDSRDRVWLLWSNSIRLASEVPPGRETFAHLGNPINIGELVSETEFTGMFGIAEVIVVSICGGHYHAFAYSFKSHA